MYSVKRRHIDLVTIQNTELQRLIDTNPEEDGQTIDPINYGDVLVPFPGFRFVQEFFTCGYNLLIF